MQAGSVSSVSPRFNSYSNSKLVDIAARVIEEFGSPTRQSEGGEFVEREGENRSEDKSEFEFSFVTTDSDLPSPMPADEIFHNGLIRSVYPVFSRDLFMESMKFGRENGKEKGDDSEKAETIRLPLRKLFSEERETSITMATTSSCSSSDADDLDGIPAESYCVWRPKEVAAEGRRIKSSSTGSNSKRWRFKDLLNRSHSDGSNDDFVILSPSSSGRKKQSEDGGKVKAVNAGKLKSAAAPPPPPVHSRYGCEKRRTYWPYRQDLVGVFGNVNGLGKKFQPF